MPEPIVEPNVPGEQTPVDPAPVVEKKTDDVVVDTPPVVEEEEVKIPKKEFDTMLKKVEDFEKSVELKRLAKLGNQEPPVVVDDTGVNKRIEALEEQAKLIQSHSFNSGLSEAYQSFVQDNPWADSDNIFDKIKNNFSTVGTETKDELLSKFETAAQIAYPTEYKQHLEDRITAKVMTTKIDTGDGGAANSATTIHQDNKPKTKEEETEDRLGGLLKQNLTWLPKK